MRVLKWTGINLALFAVTLLVALLVSGLIDQAAGREPPGVVGRVLFAWAIIFGALLPGIGLYLLAVALLPRSWSPLRERIAAIVLSPIVFLVPWIDAVSSAELRGVLYLAGISLIPGLVVRLPEWRRSPVPEP